MSQPATAVILDDPDGLGGAYDAGLVATMQQALATWATHLSGLGTLVVQLDVSDMLDGAEEAQGGSTIGLAEGTEDGRVLVEPSSLYELATGTHVAGYASDITVSVNAAMLPQLFLPGGGDAGGSVPADELDGLTLFEHEIAHGLGFGGLTSDTGSLGAAETAWDHDLALAGGVEAFTGANAERVDGGPVAVTTLRNGEGYAHLANTASDPNANDLMTGLGLGPGVRRPISSLDLAILADVGVPVTGIPGTAGITGTLAGSPARPSLAGIALADTGALSSSTVTLTASDAAGTLAFAGAPGVTATLAANGHVLVLAGGLAAVQARLAAVGDASADGRVTLSLLDGAGNAGSATFAFPPVLTGVQATADAGGPLGAGHALAFTLAFSGPVTLAGGAPVLTLSDGGTATLDAAGSGATSLRFTATVAAGQDSTDLVVTGLALGGAVLADPAGDTLADTLSPTTPGSVTGLVIDTAAPAAPTLRVSGNVVTGTAEPGSTVTLRDGGTLLRTAVADAGGAVALGTLAAGAHGLDATATDAAGNVSAPSATLDAMLPLAVAVAGGSFAADAGADVVTATTGTVQVTGNPAPASSVTLFGQGATLAYANGGGSALVVAGAAVRLSLAGGAAGSTLVAFTGTAATSYVGGAGQDLLVGGSGALSVTGGTGGTGGSLVVFGGTGTLAFTGGAERDTVVGGAGSETIHAGVGGAFAGTGGSELFALGAGSFLAGNVAGDRLAASAGGGDILAAGAGAETLDGGASADANLLFGGTGPDLIRLGAGADTVVAGPGGGTVQLGSGNATLFLGTGAATTVVAGGGGGTVVGFRPGTDRLQLAGGAASMAAGANTVVTLADGARITLVGVASGG